MAEEVKEAAKKAPKKRATGHKQHLQSLKRKVSNKSARTRIKTKVHVFQDALKAKDLEQAALLLNEVFSLVDKATKTGLFKLNKASRVKAQLSGHLVRAKSA